MKRKFIFYKNTYKIKNLKFFNFKIKSCKFQK